MRVKKVYVFYLLIVLLVILSGTISYALLQDIVSKQNIRDETPIISQVIPLSTPHPTRAFGIPLPGASTNVVSAFWKSITKKAVKTDTVDVTNCRPDPKIAGFTLGKLIALTNSGDSPLTLRISDKTTLVIPGKGKLDTEADFGHGYGIYDYLCNGSSDSVGVFVVENP